MLEAIMFGHEEIKKLIEFQEQIVAEVGKEKIEVELFEIDEEIENAVRAMCEARYDCCNSNCGKISSGRSN